MADLVTADVTAWSPNVFATSRDELFIEPTGRRLQQLTPTARRSTTSDGPKPRVEGDPTDDDIAAVDDASTEPTLAAGQGASSPLLVITRIGTVGLGVGVAVLLVFEATDAIRSLRRRTFHQLADRWAGIERRERTEARRAVFGGGAALAARITRRSD